MKRVLAPLALLVPLLLATGCRQATCVWDETRAAVDGVLPKRCCPDAEGYVHTDPIYSGGCAGDNRVGSGGHGAFQVP